LPEGRHQWGVFSLVTFFGQAKKVTRPYQLPCAKSHFRNGRNNATGLERVVGFFARLDVATSLQMNVATGESLFLFVQEK